MLQLRLVTNAVILSTSFVCNAFKNTHSIIDGEEMKALALNNAEKAFKAHVSQVSIIQYAVIIFSLVSYPKF